MLQSVRETSTVKIVEDSSSHEDFDRGKSMSDPQDEKLKTTYDQLCYSYRAIDDFRAKLLGFLPLATGTGIFLLIPMEGGVAEYIILGTNRSVRDAYYAWFILLRDLRNKEMS